MSDHETGEPRALGARPPGRGRRTARRCAARRCPSPRGWSTRSRRSPGIALLELAAGPGDTGFLAAELIRPGGELISSDLVPEMLMVAQRRAEELGLDNVRFKQIDAETSIDIDAASIDGVLCRWGYMLMADPGDRAARDAARAQARRPARARRLGRGRRRTPGARCRRARCSGTG